MASVKPSKIYTDLGINLMKEMQDLYILKKTIKYCGKVTGNQNKWRKYHIQR